MKNLKLLMIAGLLTSAMLNSAFADGFKSKKQDNTIKEKAISISFSQAMLQPGLVTSMYQQLTGGFLGGPGIQAYTLNVYYQKNLYRITGTYSQWNWFFRIDKTLIPRENSGERNLD
jgi:hypothetical protein